MKYLLVTLCLAELPASASVVITYAEDPTKYSSSLKGTAVLDFNNLPTGKSTNLAWNGVGTFDQLFVKNADAYGGAPDAAYPTGSKYSVQSASTNVVTSTLFLANDSAYFGMWWSAGDARNVLSFYDGDNLVSRFTTSSLMTPLPASYDGNPLNRNVNSSEPYAFINFFGDESTSWDRIVLSNTGSSGFESDNYTSRVAAWSPAVDGALPGIVVAEVSGTTTRLVTKEDLATTRWSLGETTSAVPEASTSLGLLALGAGGLLTRRRTKRKA